MRLQCSFTVWWLQRYSNHPFVKSIHNPSTVNRQLVHATGIMHEDKAYTKTTFTSSTKGFPYRHNNLWFYLLLEVLLNRGFILPLTLTPCCFTFCAPPRRVERWSFLLAPARALAPRYTPNLQQRIKVRSRFGTVTLHAVCIPRDFSGHDLIETER